MSYLYRVDKAQTAPNSFSAVQVAGSWNGTTPGLRNVCQINAGGKTYGIGGVGLGALGEVAGSAEYPGLGTYLLIAKFPNCGVNVSKTAKWWALTTNNYAAFKDDITEASLDAHAFSMRTQTVTLVSAFTTNLYVSLQLNNNVTTAYYATYDELRYATALDKLFFARGSVFTLK